MCPTGTAVFLLFVLLRLLVPDVSFFTICNLWGLLLFVSFVICANDDVDDTLRHHQDHHHHLHCLSCSSFFVIRSSVSHETWKRRMSTLLDMLLVEEDDDRGKERKTHSSQMRKSLYIQRLALHSFFTLSKPLSKPSPVFAKERETLESESNHSLSAMTSTSILLIPSFFSHWFLSLLLFTVRHVLSEGKANLIKRQKNFLFVSTKELDLYWQWKAAVDVLAVVPLLPSVFYLTRLKLCVSLFPFPFVSLLLFFLFSLLSLSRFALLLLWFRVYFSLLRVHKLLRSQ